MKVSQDDLLAVLAAEMGKAKPGDGSTMYELRASMGCGDGKLRKLLKALQAEGRLECVRVYRLTLNGVMGQVPGYRVKPAGKARAGK